jgi:hypothetical protein
VEGEGTLEDREGTVDGEGTVESSPVVFGKPVVALPDGLRPPGDGDAGVRLRAIELHDASNVPKRLSATWTKVQSWASGAARRGCSE